MTRRIPGHPPEVYKETFEQDLRLLIVTIEAIHEAPKQPNPKNKFADASDVDIDHVMGKLRAAFPDKTDEYLSGHVGMVIYWFYGRTHSPLANKAEAAARSGAETLGNFLKMSGYMLTFNGFCITLLGLLTGFGITTEELAKWHEVDALISRIGLHVNPEIADRFGLSILVAGVVLAGLGFALSRGSGKERG